jgi:cobalt-zinc-cadmium efflux system membrane fusion protein
MIRLVFTLSASLFLLSCGSDKTVEEAEIPKHTANVVEVTQEQIKAGDLVFAGFEKHAFDGMIHVSGKLDVPPSNRVAIHASLGGYVKEINILEGNKVAKNQTLFILENPAFLEYQQDYLEAKAQLAYLENDVDRQRTLAKEQVSAQKTYLKADAEYKTMVARTRAIKEKLQLIGFSIQAIENGKLSASVAVRSPISGFVARVAVSKGSYLDPMTMAVEIVNTDDLHLVLDVFEKDIHAVTKNQKITFHVPENPATNFEGKVVEVGKSVSETKRLIAVHAHISSQQDETNLIPGMYVKAEIHTESTTDFGLPEEAIIEVDGKHWILFVLHNKDGKVSLQKQRVEIGNTVDGYTRILDLPQNLQNKQVLVKGAFGLI